MSSFASQKDACLSAADLSRKGSIDAPIVDLVHFINECSNYFTTSSCSGRIVLFEESSPVQKKGCRWLLVSHDVVNCDILKNKLAEEIKGNTVLKFEPFVLHVQCRSLEDAQAVHAVAVASGFRNSGISVGKKGKVIAAVRSTHSLEVPLADNGRLLVSEEYVEYITKIANQKMEENIRRIERFFVNLKASLVERAKQEQEPRQKNQGVKKKAWHTRKEDTKKEETSKSDNVEEGTRDAEFDFDEFESVNSLFMKQDDMG